MKTGRTLIAGAAVATTLSGAALVAQTKPSNNKPTVIPFPGLVKADSQAKACLADQRQFTIDFLHEAIIHRPVTAEQEQEIKQASRAVIKTVIETKLREQVKDLNGDEALKGPEGKKASAAVGGVMHTARVQFRAAVLTILGFENKLLDERIIVKKTDISPKEVQECKHPGPK